MAFTHSAADDITLGRGQLYFAPFVNGTTTPQASELYLGNTPGCSLTGEVQTLDHYTADTKVRLKDRSIVIEANYSGTVTTDNLSSDNMARFFLGEKSTVTVVAATGITETFTNPVVDSVIQLGRTNANPAGARKVANVVIAGKVLGTDYELDAELGLLRILVTAASFAVTYDVQASTRDRVVSKGTLVKGALHFIADNPAGSNRDIYMPSVTLAPNGDFQIKGDGTDWAQMEFTLEVLTKNSSTSAIYIDGRPV